MLKTILLFSFLVLSVNLAQANQNNSIIECTAIRLIKKDIGFELGYKFQITKTLDKMMMDDYSVNCKPFASRTPGAVIVRCEDGNILKLNQNRTQAVLKDVAFFNCR